ncbi:hypothetical protein RB195_023660 [Necator americanus]
MRPASIAFVPVRETTDQLTDQHPRAHLFDPTVFPALCYTAETWADIAATSRKLLTTYKALEKCLLKCNQRTQEPAFAAPTYKQCPIFATHVESKA